MEERVKLALYKFDKAIAVRILYMDEVFRDSPDYFTSKSGFQVKSDATPDLDSYAIWLWGSDGSDDNELLVRNFNTNEERNEYISDMKQALKEWSESWTGFKADDVNEVNWVNEIEREEIIF